MKTIHRFSLAMFLSLIMAQLYYLGGDRVVISLREAVVMIVLWGIAFLFMVVEDKDKGDEK